MNKRKVRLTTWAGVATAVAIVASAAKAILDGDPATTPDWPAVGAVISAAVGLMMSKDGDE